MNKLLISLLSLTGVAGISTGGYFLLGGNSKNVAQQEKDQSKGDQTKSQQPESQDTKGQGGKQKQAQEGSQDQPQSPSSSQES